MREIKSCTLCPRNCHAKRDEQGGKGFCRMGTLPVVARAALHFWEEPCISGSNGSGAVFFSGCSLQCVFCQNYEISTLRSAGKAVTPKELSDIFLRLAEKGAHNINLVNPTHFADSIGEALTIKKLPCPVVYNSGGYEKPETLKKLEGLVDIYLPDLKYAGNELGKKYSGAEDYFTVAEKAIAEMVRQTGEAKFDENGLIRSGTMVRHLILPGNTKNSINVLHFIKEKYPHGVPVSLMAQYIPCGKAEKFPEINRRITKREFEKVQDVLFELNLEGYVQERSSAKKDFVPAFNLEGVSPESNHTTGGN